MSISFFLSRFLCVKVKVDYLTSKAFAFWLGRIRDLPLKLQQLQKREKETRLKTHHHLAGGYICTRDIVVLLSKLLGETY
jgi:hypothetical protein